MTLTLTTTILSLLVYQALSWQALPQIPSGRRSQYFVLRDDGGYKYGYDTGDGSAAKQSGDASNQVEGHYFYKAANGQKLDLKYTSGVQGFVPEGLDKLQGGLTGSVPVIPVHIQYASSSDDSSSDDQANTGDASYNFNINTDTYKRQETSDARGNVQGSYSYRNNAGVHNLEYIAGDNTGFVATSGSLSTPNGLKGGQEAAQAYQTYQAPAATNLLPLPKVGYNYVAPNSAVSTSAGGAGYSYSYSTGDSSKTESADASGNVQGRYSYQNGAGTHDLSYVAGAQTGFQPTSGSLAQPNGLATSTGALQSTLLPVPSVGATNYGTIRNSAASALSTGASTDGSYSFGYNTGTQSKQESSDASGNVQGRYAYQNNAGAHDLSYVAGAQTGFQVTGGSLAQPNGLGTESGVLASSVYTSRYANSSPTVSSTTSHDGSYAFSYNTGTQSRQESADSSGNVQGRYAYNDNSGSHDLSYIAGSGTGFVPTGGSLAQPNGVAGGSSSLPVPIAPTQGYLPPPGISTKLQSDFSSEESSTDDQANTGDASYSFSIDTDEYKRQEAADASGNVQGSFSYKNAAGNHDLSFVAGQNTGFQPTGGSLKIPPGLSESQLRSTASQSYINAGKSSAYSYQTDVPFLHTQPSINSFIPSTKSSYRLGNIQVHSYLPPSNEKHKFGYIFNTA